MKKSYGPWLFWNERYKALAMPERVQIPMKRSLLTFRAFLEFKAADLWLGVFWKFHKHEIRYDRLGQKLKHIRGEYILNLWICFVPCVPLHLIFVFDRNSIRVMYE